MKMIKEKILEYLTITIQTKHNMRKRIYQLEDKLKEAKANERYAIEQMNKYKSKFKIIKSQKDKIQKEYKETLDNIYGG